MTSVLRIEWKRVTPLYQSRVSHTVQCGPITSQCISIINDQVVWVWNHSINQDRDGELESKWDSYCLWALCEGPWVLRAEAGATSSFHSFFKGQDVFVSLPTWFQMTLCFAALPGMFDRLKGEMKASVVVMYWWSIPTLIVGISDRYRLSKYRSSVYCPARIFLAYIDNRYRHSVHLCINSQYWPPTYQQSISMIHVEDQILSTATVAMVDLCTPLR